ncbi:hypothetical protein FKY78_09055 [Enterococcus faecalis]|uniref:YopX family protein n=1 Tax=Enterococcus faecalis TaxID=1351 RepID=UPI000CF3560F|nr:YopX family protein [Enterococcus faecalis]EGO2668916.1 hypothetical protein [Enterococcus faecalis]EGO2693888.1 hypothetical protein [Enterococcus faecalis]EGO5911057.1 hypothetical protein [Enterococcus faecalis]EGO6065631.1 hypothetical protein [Enterococcus faecalis]EHS7923624.1 hypothetical protein [Enterococcus faecalis]
MIPKFRAWDKNTEDMVDVKMIDLEKDGSIGCIVDYNGINLDVSECVLMQSTGVKDKNGVEIFEGGIGWDDHQEVHGQVIFENGAFKYEWENISEDLFEVTDDIEIVGNIYENSELLEGTE